MAGVAAAPSLLPSGGGGSFTMYHFASFASMEVTVTMLPRFTMPRIVTAFGGCYGPFSPNQPVDVPLWLALHIRQTDTCIIEPPSFVALQYLRNIVEQEKMNDSTFEALPFYFFEVVKKLCENSAAAEDVPHVTEVLRLVDEVKAVRRQKLQQSMAVFEAEGSPVVIPGIKLTNIVNHELQYLRTSFAKVLKQSSLMKSRREQLIGGPIEGSTPIRPSGVAPSSFSTPLTTMTLTTAATAEPAAARLSGPSGLGGAGESSSSFAETSSIAATLPSVGQQVISGLDSMPAVAAVTDETDLSSIALDDLSSPPPVKKRRTLRQT